MKASELCKLLIRSQREWGDLEVHFIDLHDDATAEVEGLEYDGSKFILGDLTRTQDNAAYFDDEAVEGE